MEMLWRVIYNYKKAMFILDTPGIDCTVYFGTHCLINCMGAYKWNLQVKPVEILALNCGHNSILVKWSHTEVMLLLSLP